LLPETKMTLGEPVTTDGAGRFRFIARAGPSRLFRFAYRARLVQTAFSATTDLRLRVRAGLVFSVNRRRLRNGQTLRYAGRLKGLDPAGRFVEVQVRDGRRWRLVCSTRVNRRGRYACRHRFRQTFSPTRYVFRARVRRQAQLAYDGTVTRRVAVVVRP